MFVDEDCALKSVQRKDSWVEGDTGLRECQPGLQDIRLYATSVASSDVAGQCWVVGGS